MASELDLKTPCFVFDEGQLRGNFTDFQNALTTHWSSNSIVAYSVKTNPLAWVLEVARRAGCWAEVVSDEEYDWALKCGYTPESIVFNGPIKGKSHFLAALAAGGVVNIDSERELAWLDEYASRETASVAVGLRVNIDLESFCPGETVTGAAGGRFGFCFENGELDRALARVQAHGDRVRLSGLHLHVTTQSRSVGVYRVLASHAARIVADHELNLDYIDIGGGFFGGGSLNGGAYERYVEAIAEELSGVCDCASTMLIVEPGGAVVCTPGIYAGRVLDVKDTTVDRFVVTELSRINIDHEMKKESYVHSVLYAGNTSQSSVLENEPPAANDKEKGGSAFERPNVRDCAAGFSGRAIKPRQVLCGYTCMESDRLCVLSDEPELQVGDLVIIHNAGAYSMSFTPEFFIQHPPAVYSKDATGSYTLVRP
ncbi:MAG: hypothetical protein RSB16_03275 [Raoultibacter sp.]